MLIHNRIFPLLLLIGYANLISLSLKAMTDSDNEMSHEIETTMKRATQKIEHISNNGAQQFSIIRDKCDKGNEIFSFLLQDLESQEKTTCILASKEPHTELVFSLNITELTTGQDWRDQISSLFNALCSYAQEQRGYQAIALSIKNIDDAVQSVLSSLGFDYIRDIQNKLYMIKKFETCTVS